MDSHLPSGTCLPTTFINQSNELLLRWTVSLLPTPPPHLYPAQDTLGMEVAQAAYVSTMFDVGAGIGGPLCGLLADWALGVYT